MDKKRGLGAGTKRFKVEESGDLLNRVFGEGSTPPASEAAAEKATTKVKRSPKELNSIPGKQMTQADSEGRVAKYFKIDKELATQLGVFAIQHNVRERDLIEYILRRFFEEQAK